MTTSSTALTSPNAARKLPGAVLVLAAMTVLHTGSALTTELFDDLGAAGTTWLRVGFAALVLLAFTGRSLWRAVKAAPGRDLVAVLLLGTVSGAMMLLFSEAAARIPLGTATALEFLGPLAVAVASLSRRRELAWLLLAAGECSASPRPGRAASIRPVCCSAWARGPAGPCTSSAPSTSAAVSGPGTAWPCR